MPYTVQISQERVGYREFSTKEAALAWLETDDLKHVTWGGWLIEAELLEPNGEENQ